MTVDIADAFKAKKRAEEQINQIISELEKETGLKTVVSSVTFEMAGYGHCFKRVVIVLKL
jgi:hypothetical protein